jgi:DNA-binding XRE family transcriptional regulator
MEAYSVAELRGYLGLSQFAFATMLGLTQSAISQEEKKITRAPKWVYLAVKGARFTHNGLSGCLCSQCHRCNLEATFGKGR